MPFKCKPLAEFQGSLAENGIMVRVGEGPHNSIRETFHGGPITYKTPRRLFVKYYDTDPARKFARQVEKDILPPSFPE